MSALYERRRRAAEAFMDGMGVNDVISVKALDDATETATRVRIDEEIVTAARTAYGNGDRHWAALSRAIEAAFVAAGFEVEK